MIDIQAELTTDGVLPTGPVSAWPKARHDALMKAHQQSVTEQMKIDQERGHGEIDLSRAPAHVRAEIRKQIADSKGNKKMPGLGKMAQGFARTAKQAIQHGKVSAEIRNERYDTCKACPQFNPESRRCASCGCFMEAKTWVGGDPNMLCPLQKWER